MISEHRPEESGLNHVKGPQEQRTWGYEWGRGTGESGNSSGFSKSYHRRLHKAKPAVGNRPLAKRNPEGNTISECSGALHTPVFQSDRRTDGRTDRRNGIQSSRFADIFLLGTLALY